MPLFFSDTKKKQTKQMTPLSVKTDLCVSGPFNVQKNAMLTPVEDLSRQDNMQPTSFGNYSMGSTSRKSSAGSSKMAGVNQRSNSGDLPILVVTSSFRGESENEMSTHTGDTLRLLSKSVVNGWIFVQSIYQKDHAGWVPKDTVRVLDIMPTVNSASRSSSTSSGSSSNGSLSFASPAMSTDSHITTMTPTKKHSINHTMIPSWYDYKKKQHQLDTPPATPLSFKPNAPKGYHPPIHSNTTPPMPSGQNFSRLISVLEGSASPSASPFVSKTSKFNGGAFPYRNITVHSVHCTHNRYWYRVDTLSCDTQVHLCRFYQDFYDLQVEILLNRERFGNDIKEMPKLPNLISPSDDFSQSNMASRCISLNHYLHTIVDTIAHTHNRLLYQILVAWLDIRSGDFEHTSELNDDEIMRLLEPKHLRRRIDFSSVNDKSLYQRRSYSDSQLQSMDEDLTQFQEQVQQSISKDRDVPRTLDPYAKPSNDIDDDTPTQPLFSQPPRVVQRSSSQPNVLCPVTSTKSTPEASINFRILSAGTAFTLNLPRNISFDELKLRIASELNVYLSSLHLKFKDEKHSLFRPLRSTFDIQSCVQETSRFGGDTIILKVA